MHCTGGASARVRNGLVCLLCMGVVSPYVRQAAKRMQSHPQHSLGQGNCLAKVKLPFGTAIGASKGIHRLKSWRNRRARLASAVLGCRVESRPAVRSRPCSPLPAAGLVPPPSRASSSRPICAYSLMHSGCHRGRNIAAQVAFLSSGTSHVRSSACMCELPTGMIHTS